MGRKDRVCFPNQAKRALELFPSARLHWFDYCGHFPRGDVPQEAARLILASTGERIERREQEFALSGAGSDGRAD